MIGLDGSLSSIDPIGRLRCGLRVIHEITDAARSPTLPV
jgi:hypothetical protein